MEARVDSESGIVGTDSRGVSRYPPAVWPPIASLRAREPEGPRAPQLSYLKGTAPEVLARPPGGPGRHWHSGWQLACLARAAGFESQQNEGAQMSSELGSSGAMVVNLDSL